jgi:hypothetical protein
MNSPVAGAPDRALATYALTQPEWDTDTALAQHGGVNLQATREALNAQLAPLKTTEPKLDGEDSNAIRTYLRAIGVKIRPDFSPDQVTAWLDAMVLTFSNLPARCTIRALLDAVHMTFKFPSDAEEKIRALAEANAAKQRLAIHRLDLMQAELHRRRNPQPAISDDTGRPISDEEVHRWQRNGMSTLIRLGLASGNIRPEQLLPPDDPTLPQEGST